MDAKNFLYYALAFSVVLFVIFVCTAIYHVIRILKDVADVTDTVKNTAEKVNEDIIKISSKIAETTAQIGDYAIKPLTLISYLGDRVKPMVDMIQQKSEEFKKAMHPNEPESPKGAGKKRRFGKKK